jgi:hypothetical protein
MIGVKKRGDTSSKLRAKWRRSTPSGFDLGTSKIRLKIDYVAPSDPLSVSWRGIASACSAKVQWLFFVSPEPTASANQRRALVTDVPLVPHGLLFQKLLLQNRASRPKNVA